MVALSVLGGLARCVFDPGLTRSTPLGLLRVLLRVKVKVRVRVSPSG